MPNPVVPLRKRVTKQGSLGASALADLRNLSSARPLERQLSHHFSASSAMNEHPRPPFPNQSQSMPGYTTAMDPVPDHGEKSYRRSGRLAGMKAIITGADSGIGRAVAIAYAREGADV